MQRTPPTTEPLSRNFLDDTLVWILTGEIQWEKQRQARHTNTRPTDLLSGTLEHSALRSWDLPSADRPLMRIGSLKTG